MDQQGSNLRSFNQHHAMLFWMAVEDTARARRVFDLGLTQRYPLNADLFIASGKLSYAASRDWEGWYASLPKVAQ